VIRVPPIIWSLTAFLFLGACVTTGEQPGPTIDQSASKVETGDSGIVGQDSNSDFEYKPVRFEDMKPGQRPNISSDEAGYWMMTDRMEKSLQTSGSLVLDPELNNYVSGITCKLAGPYCDDIRVYVVRHPQFNASMMPNGTMVVWTGALLRARNEAQIAAVIGHEIGHYLRRHSIQSMRDHKDKADFLVFFSMAMGIAGVPVVADIAQFAIISSIYAFSRDNEREADRIGLDLMTKAGYDPREASKVWRNLIKEVEVDEDYQNRSIFFSTHPQSEERRNTLLGLAKNIVAKGEQGQRYRSRYDEMTAKLRPLYVRDELHLRRYASLEVLLKMMIEENADDGHFQYLLGELYRLRIDEGDRKLALAAYETAIEKGAPPEVYRSMGLILMKLDEEKTKGRDLLSRYLKLRPNAKDRKMVEFMIRPGG
jgi:beta-barrel assembly-enhancing protease